MIFWWHSTHCAAGAAGAVSSTVRSAKRPGSSPPGHGHEVLKVLFIGLVCLMFVE